MGRSNSKERDIASKISMTQQPTAVKEIEILVALHPHYAQTNGDLSFKKGDQMQLLDTNNSDWWFVRHQLSHLTGYVPRNFVTKQKSIDDEICSEKWYAGKISRSQAEEILQSSSLANGTFLIREKDGEFALTIRDNYDAEGEPIKHYKIRLLDGNLGYFISTRRIFKSLQDLVKHYSESADGLCWQLTSPATLLTPPDEPSDAKEDWEIPRHQLPLERKVGDGNFGDVFYAKWRGIVEVAVKCMKHDTMSSDAFLEEAQIMKQCDHPNLVKLFAVCTREEPFYIVTEYMANGSLLGYLRKESSALETEDLINMSSQVANGMKYLEHRKLVHRDLAARNVLVGSDSSSVKIADFGLARKLKEESIYSASTTTKFPLKWTAPEAIAHGSFTVKSDVWSFGVLLYEIMTRGGVPYQDMTNREVIERVDLGYRMPMPSGCPEEIYEEVMLRCWDKVAECRPSFDRIYQLLCDSLYESTSYDCSDDDNDEPVICNVQNANKN